MKSVTSCFEKKGKCSMMLISYSINVQYLSKAAFKISTIFAPHSCSNRIFSVKAATTELKEAKAKYKYSTCADFHSNF